MKKVYIISSEDCGIDSVYSNRKAAEKRVKEMREDGYEGVEILSEILRSK